MVNKFEMIDYIWYCNLCGIGCVEADSLEDAINKSNIDHYKPKSKGKSKHNRLVKKKVCNRVIDVTLLSDITKIKEMNYKWICTRNCTGWIAADTQSEALSKARKLHRNQGKCRRGIRIINER